MFRKLRANGGMRGCSQQAGSYLNFNERVDVLFDAVVFSFMYQIYNNDTAAAICFS